MRRVEMVREIWESSMLVQKIAYICSVSSMKYANQTYFSYSLCVSTFFTSGLTATCYSLLMGDAE